MQFHHSLKRARELLSAYYPTLSEISHVKDGSVYSSSRQRVPFDVALANYLTSKSEASFSSLGDDTLHLLLSKPVCLRVYSGFL